MLNQYNKVGLLEYLGSNYSGWQRQKNSLSIQNILEEKLSIIYAEKILTIGSGRTDKGVHSFGQVFNFKANKIIDNGKLVRSVNALLPEDIRLIDIKDIDINFNALHNTVAKSYIYKIINSDIEPVFESDRALWIRSMIDINKLTTTLKYLEGCHDFASFAVTKTKKEDTVRTVEYIKVTTNYDKILIEIKADGFLHNMVRVIVGTSLAIAKGSDEPKKILDILTAKDRRVAGITAPANGLYQLLVEYEDNIFNIDKNRLISRL